MSVIPIILLLVVIAVIGVTIFIWRRKTASKNRSDANKDKVSNENMECAN